MTAAAAAGPSNPKRPAMSRTDGLGKPRPRTRKSNGATDAERAHEAHQLRLGGTPWPEVARAVGYINAQVAQMAVNAYLQKAVAERATVDRQLALQLELDRLDALHAALWPAALRCDLRAVNLILQISDRRARLENFEQISKESQARDQWNSSCPVRRWQTICVASRLSESERRSATAATRTCWTSSSDQLPASPSSTAPDPTAASRWTPTATNRRTYGARGRKVRSGRPLQVVH